MPQGDYIEYWRKKHGYRMDHFERMRKKAARAGKRRALYAQKVKGRKAKLFHQQRFKEKAAMRKKIIMQEEKMNQRLNIRLQKKG